MITEQQFLDACKIIENYQKQINSIVVKVSQIKPTKTKIDDWLYNNYINGITEITDLISLRLFNALKYRNSNLPSTIKIPELIYIEDITRRRFLKIRNAGNKTWFELAEILNRKNPYNYDSID